MLIIVMALLLGVVCGMRAMTGPAAVSWAARLGWLPVGKTWLAFLGYSATPYILTLLAVGEIINDKLPKTPSRKAPGPFVARIVSGALCGAAMGSIGRQMIAGAVAGAVGAVLGTIRGYTFRARLAQMFGNDLPAALIEDAIAIGIAVLVVTRLH